MLKPGVLYLVLGENKCTLLSWASTPRSRKKFGLRSKAYNTMFGQSQLCFRLKNHFDERDGERDREKQKERSC